jgi:hypothetical protein
LAPPRAICPPPPPLTCDRSRPIRRTARIKRMRTPSPGPRWTGGPGPPGRSTDLASC